MTRVNAKNLVALGGFLAASAAVALIGGAATAASVTTWYPSLVKPPFNPPDWVFGPVWTVLYIMMAVAAWRVWCSDKPGRVPALVAYALQLVLNLGWSLIFFGLQQPGLALIEIIGLVAMVAVTMHRFWPIDRTAGLLLAPYLAWISFATILNAAIWLLN
jgi:tryptophan-rich sensory protein